MNKLIFAKPTIDTFCFVIIFFKDGKLYLDEVFFADSINELSENILQHTKNVSQIRYDVSIFMQDGKNLRAKTNANVFLYKPKQKLEERFTANKEWIQENLIIDNEYENEDYIKFISLINDYQANNVSQNTIAIDIISDIARCFRMKRD